MNEHDEIADKAQPQNVSQKENPVETKKSKPVKEKMIKVKESEHKRLIDEAAKYKDQYVRLYAEFDNARKRMDREKMEFVKYANEDLIVDFLEVVDNLHRTVDAAKAKHQDYDAFLKGVEMVMKNIDQLLTKNGVKPIDVQGKQFDPHCHEVLLQEESDEYDDGAVIQEFQKGYMLQEKVIRTSKVKLAKKKST